jgi:phosphoadenosine phosphosulfate reductase
MHIENVVIVSQVSLLHPDFVRSQADSFESASPTDILRWVSEACGQRVAIGTSFQAAGLVIIDHAVKAGFPIPVFTIDTGLLFPETIELKERLERFFGIAIEAIHPEQTPEQQRNDLGDRLWERTPNLCCTLRKVMPLQKKLKDLDGWITGLRRDQSQGRNETRILELYQADPTRERKILKVNPLANWSRERVWDYVRQNQIPYNPLTDRGFKSIGCHPCTTAVTDDVDERAGRWSGLNKTECGIHTFLGENI